MKRLVILGAGSSGRGHLGQLAHEAGWELVLVDKDPALVHALRQAGRYRVRLHRAEGFRDALIEGFRAYEVGETDAIVAEALQVPLVLTCLFSQNLPQIAPLVARILRCRYDSRIQTPLNVICCENMQHSSSRLRSLVTPLLPAEVTQWLAGRVGFPDCMISRVVPLSNDPLELIAEDYNEWTVQAAGFEGPPVDLPAMEVVENQEARLGRKFFLHNGGHAVCAYWGFHRGHRYIHEAVADPVVLQRVTAAMAELAQVVSRRYGFDYQGALAYGMSLGPRGAIAAMQDQILRVVRDPLRKLSRQERLVAPAALAAKYGTPYEQLVQAIAAALHYCHPDDPQSLQMQQRLHAEGPRQALPAILGLPPEHAVVERALSAYRGWQETTLPLASPESRAVVRPVGE